MSVKRLWLVVVLAMACISVLGQTATQGDKATNPEIQKTLDRLRAIIQADGLEYTVGYNKAMDYKLQDITGLLHHPATQDQEDHFAGGCANPIPANSCETEATYPAHYVGWTSTIKDQSQCGSCWAFSSVAEVEAAYLMESGAPEATATAGSAVAPTVSGSSPNLSEQELVSCNSAGYSCNGGDVDVLGEFTSTGTHPGIVTETCEPYTSGGGSTGTCKICSSPTYTPVVSWGYITDDNTINTKAAIQQAITTYGSVTTYIDAEDAFQSYTGGVFSDPSASKTGNTNHAVILCGWDDTLGAWLLKNSWGSNTGWGINGWMWIKYGDSSIGQGCAWATTTGAPTTKYSISGTVSGAVTSGVTITLSGAASATATTASGGTYTFSNLANGSYTVTPSLSGYSFSPTSTAVTVSGANKTGVNFTSTSGGGTTQLLLNPGFESGNNGNWTISTSKSHTVITTTTKPVAAHGGSYKASLGAYNGSYYESETDSIAQTVTIPSTATAATLSFWYYITTQETTTSAANDKLTVTVENTSGTVLATPTTLSNLNKTTAWTQKTGLSLLSYKGQTVVIRFKAVTNSTLGTFFGLDDTALNVTQ